MDLQFCIGNNALWDNDRILRADVLSLLKLRAGIEHATNILRRVGPDVVEIRLIGATLITPSPAIMSLQALLDELNTSEEGISYIMLITLADIIGQAMSKVTKMEDTL